MSSIALSRLSKAALATTALGVAVELLVATRYGYHRDELYFLEAGRHPALGYVDQPPITPLVSRLADILFEGSLLGLRLLPALAFGGMILLAALTARELGGGRFAQGLAALGVAASPVFLGAGHLVSTAIFDQVAWGLALFLVVRLIRTGDERLWLAVGAVVGLGLLNKHTVVFLVLGLAAGLVLSRESARFRSPWLWAGAAVALALFAPNLAWQAASGWPTLEMLESLREQRSGPAGSLEFVAFQPLFVNLAMTPVWLAGLWWLMRTGEGRPYRPLGCAYVSLFGLFLVIGAKPYYISPLYPLLLAAGGVAIERARAARRSVPRTPAIVAAVLLCGLVAVPAAIPVIPERSLADSGVNELSPEMGEQIGWPELVDQVARIHRALPRAERSGARILTGNYGEAGAIDLLGPERGLPGAISGHNSYWRWGYGSDDRSPVIIAVGIPRQSIAWMFDRIELAGRIGNEQGIDNKERGLPIWLCRGQRLSWSRAWPRLKHYD